MLGRHKRGAFMLATIALVFMLGLSAYYKQASAPGTEISIHSKESTELSESVLTDDELSDRIKQLVRGLEYPDKVAEDFNRMAIEWKSELGRPVLIVWKDRLARVHKFYQENKITKKQIAKIEEGVLRELCERVRRQFKNKRLGFELSDVIENRHANCLGFTQLIYIAGNAVGLSVRPIEVLDPLISLEGEVGGGHIACIIDLFDGRLVMADVLLLFEIPRRAFKLEDQFVKVGNYWELKDKDNPLHVHKRIRLLDGKGLLASIYNCRGVVYAAKGEYDRAILVYNKAIENDPGKALAYFNRGVTYYHKGEYDRAILDYTKAIEINLRFTEAYYNRGMIYANKGEYDRAIFDYDKAIEINPKFTDTYINRGGVYEDKGEYDRAIQDCTKVIEIDPKAADAYNNRGNIYFKKDDYDRAILDYEKAIEINPDSAVTYLNRAEVYAKLGKPQESKKDLLKALDLDPELKESAKELSEQYELDLKLD